MGHWMIRTSSNVIAGPYDDDQVRELIFDGNLSPQDEICTANGYWFYLHEQEEAAKQLGFEIPANLLKPDPDEEVTITDSEKTEQNIPHPDEESIPDIPQVAQTRAEVIDFTKNRALREFQKQKKSVPEIQRPEILGKLENPSLWKFVTFLLVVMVGVLMFLILRLIET